MAQCRSLFGRREDIHRWSGEEKNIAVLVLLVQLADFFWDLSVCLFAKAEDFVGAR